MMDSSTMSTGAGAGGSTPSADTKVLADIETVSERIDLCAEMLKETGGHFDDSNEALLGVVGFLEACAPRMVELVEAAAQGALTEATLMRCLEVNDRLLKILSDCDNPAGVVTERTASSEGAEAGAATGVAKAKSNLDVDLDDLLLDDPSTTKENANVGTGKSDDPFGANDMLKPTPIDGTKKPAATDFTIDDDADGGASKKDDDFDDFFRERQGVK